MGIQLECQYEEDLTKQPEARVRWYEAAGGTTLWEMTTDPVRSPRLEVLRRLHVVDVTRPSHDVVGGFFFDFESLEDVGAVAACRSVRIHDDGVAVTARTQASCPRPY